MLNSDNFSKNLNKFRKLWAEKGVNIALKKALHLTKKNLSQPAYKRTSLKRDFILKSINKYDLTQDIERLLSFGLLRPLDGIKSDIHRLPVDSADKILGEATRLLNNEFKIYGHLEVQYKSSRFSWMNDPLTSFEWPQIMSRAQLKNQKPYGTDVKTVWEIARFQFLLPLALAYILTGEERYARFAHDKVNSWIDENKFMHGPHCIIPMESAIRLMNWCVYLPLLEVLQFSDSSFLEKLMESILEQLIYIRENLEVSPSSATNHYLANLVGLLLGRLIFPSLKWALESAEFAERELVIEIERQFLEGGINFEGSLSYHRLSSEICLMGVELIKNSGRDMPIRIVDRLQKVASFTRFYTEAANECPIIGDNDSGIFVKFFTGQELNRHLYLKYLFECILDDMSEPNSIEDFLCSVHFTTTDQSYSFNDDKIKADSDSELQIRDFNGLVIARYKNEALFFNALRSAEGHTHNDKLSIYPVIGGKLLFLDRGSFSYAGYIDKRNEDRMSSSHNGPVINRWEQSRIWKEDLFYIGGEAKCDNRIEFSIDFVNITGWHTGYSRYSAGMKVYRKVIWDTRDRTMIITDWVEGKKISRDVLFTWCFLINPIWTGEIENNTLKLINEKHTVYFEGMNGIGLILARGLYCPNYQLEAPCLALRASRTAAAGEKTHFILRY
jgi:hypothetical protein